MMPLLSLNRFIEGGWREARDSPHPTSGLPQPDIPEYLQHPGQKFCEASCPFPTHRKHCPHSPTPCEVVMVTLTSQTSGRFSHLSAELEDLNPGHLLAGPDPF